MAEIGGSGARFEIGAVISRAFETIASNFLLFCGLSLVLAGIPQFFLEYWQTGAWGFRADTNPYSFNTSFVAASAVTGLVSIVTGAILQAALTRATVLNLSGEKPQFVPCLMVGITLLLPLIAIGILSGIGFIVGLILLILPGIILWLAWAVVTPAYVQEKIGIFEAFGRSADLTRGARFNIFLTMLIMIVLLWVINIPLGFVTGAMGRLGNVIVSAALAAVVSALSTMVMVTVQASIYVELRQMKEGVAPADLEAIFA